MVLGFGTVHPPGEDSDYDGFYYRADEMPQLAADIVGKPLCIEHDTSEPVGTVTNAWVGRDKALNVIFETKPTFKGFLAENLLVQDVCKDLSLGHNVKIDRRNQRVLSKEATEVSICVKGDREGTHVRTVGPEFVGVTDGAHKEEDDGYIKEGAPQRVENTSLMSSEEPQKSDAPPADTKMATETTAAAANEGESSARGENSFNQELLDLVTKQQGEITAMKARYAEEQTRAKEAEDKNEKYRAKGKRKRSELIDSSIAKMVKFLLQNEQFKGTLKPQEEQIDAIMQGLKESEEAAPLVDVVACAASALSGTTTRLEEEYQSTKRLKTEVDQLKEQIATYQKPALASARERFGATSAAEKAPAAAPTAPGQPQWSRVAQRMPRGMKPVQAPRDGVQVRNPDFWKHLVAGGTSTGTGMGWFDEANLVGKRYEDGQRPKVLPHQDA